MGRKNYPKRAAAGTPGIGRVLALSLLVAVLAAGAYARNAVWLSEITLLEDTVAGSPGKGRAHHNLGRAYDTSGLPQQAFEQYLIATTVDPDFAKAHESLGISYMSMNQTALARQQFEIALRLDPGLKEANVFLSYILKQHP